jgi:hypothetical protein
MLTGNREARGETAARVGNCQSLDLRLTFPE